MKSLTLIVILALATAGCGTLGAVLDQATGLLDNREARQESGWSWDGFVTCGPPTLHLETGDRWCARTLAPTMVDCQDGYGMEFWFGDTLSGISRQVLFNLCQDSKVGERWSHLDGVYSAGRLVVHDANRGSKPN